MGVLSETTGNVTPTSGSVWPLRRHPAPGRLRAVLSRPAQKRGTRGLMSRRLRGALVLLGTAALALGIAACGNAQAVTQTTLKPKSPLPLTGPDPGVTSNSIDVGTLATETGP